MFFSFQKFQFWSSRTHLNLFCARVQEYLGLKQHVVGRGDTILVIIVIPFFSLFNGWFLLLLVPIVLSGFFNACPKCSTWFVRKRLSKEEIDRFNFREDITRSDKIKDNMGNIVGKIERKEQVTRTSITYLNTYCCQQCGFVWNSKSKEKH